MDDKNNPGMTDEERRQKMIKLAVEILSLARSMLLANLRYLDAALSQFALVPTDVEKRTMLTDGVHLIFNPAHVLKNYKEASEIPVRDYLHMVLHCVFSHMYLAGGMDRVYWDLACDIAVENIITELNLNATNTFRDRTQKEFIDIMRKQVKRMTAESIYVYLRDSNFTPSRIAQIRGLFLSDDHEIWYMSPKEAEKYCGVKMYGTSRDEQQKIWQDISHRMKIDRAAFGKKPGDKPGSLSQNLDEVNRERYDYTAFLKKFAVTGEVMKINDDEFDNIFYTYGLQMYGNVPLVEPLEYKETKRVREFVIAIDTSGSTSGTLVQKFIQKTYNILMSTESFFSQVNIHIIQCDADIQEHVKITSAEELKEYIKRMKLLGHGGTDFRPVFSLVNSLVAEKEFSNLKGLLYFTDGHGTFPAAKPDYQTAFVFVDDEYNNLDVPPWAIKLVLPAEDFDDTTVDFM